MNPSPFVRRFRPTHALFAAGLSLSAVSLIAAPAAPSSTETTSSAYTNQPTYTSPPPPPIYDYSSSNFGGFYSGSGLSSNPRYDYYYYSQADVFYFPPTPPPLGEQLNRLTSEFSFASKAPTRAVPIAPQLAPFVGEIFYPPLATHLHNEDLTKSQHQRLADYRQTRTSLLDALHARIESLLDADAATRERGLAAFAEEQAPLISAFEQEAETIRDDLVRGNFFQSGVSWADWDANRSWRLGDDLRYESRVDEFKVIRAAAYFYPYFVPAQRRLLQELALELNEPLVDPSTNISLEAPDAYFYFSPETSRSHLPANLPDDLAAKIASYQKEKSALKEELRSAIYKLDRAFFYFTRKNKLDPLIEEQTPRIAALENLAEEIRHALAAIPNPHRPHRVSGTNELSQRVSDYMRDRTQVLRALNEKLAKTQKAFPTARIELKRVGDSYEITIISNRRQTKADDRAFAEFQIGLARFNEDQVNKYAALARTKDTLRADILRLAKNGAESKPGGAGGDHSIELMLKNFANEYRERERWDYYADYDYAVFEPGLSPGQRRLLFAAALQKLELPIPHGSSQP